MAKLNLFKDVIKPTPKQKEFLNTVRNNKYILYGGAAGGGKSYVLRWCLVWLLIDWYIKTGLKGIRVGLFCEDYPSLDDRQISKIKMEFPEWLGTYKESNHEFTLSEELGAGVICFRNLDKPSKYLSSEFAAIAIDELTLNDKNVFEFLRMRLRWTGINNTKLIAATNPGGKGHMWVKDLFIDRNFTSEMKAYADKIAYVQARASDNPHLSQSYIDDLNTLPEKLRKAYLDGDWNIFEGQVFTEFRNDIHVVEPFEIPKTWQRYRSMDWGYTKPYAVYSYAVDYDDVLYITGEWYGCKPGLPDTGTQETAREVALKLKGIKGYHGVADPAIWQKTGHDGPPIGEIFANEGIYWTPADNARVDGLMQVHQRLKEGKLKIFSSCVHLIRTLPALTYDKTKVEDVDTKQEDHAYDAVRYMCMARPIKASKVQKQFNDGYRYEDDDVGGTTAWGI